MRVELLYLDGCPSRTVAEQRLTEALRVLGRDDIRLERRLVETAEQVEELKFTGSPTIRVDGIDPFASGNEQIGVACRVYRTPTGISGSPDTAQLLEALS